MWLNAHEPMKFTPCSAFTFGAAGRAASPVCATIPIQTAIARATTPRKARMAASLIGNVWRNVRGMSSRCTTDDLSRCLELLGGQTDVRMSSEAAREDTGRLDGRRDDIPRTFRQTFPIRLAAMRAFLGVVALAIAVWMGIVAHTGEAARPAAPNVKALQGVNFIGSCAFSHMAMDDPIVYPRQPGVSHDHSFGGNTSTSALSTLRTLRAGSTTCKRDGETAAYWMPTLLLNGQMVPPRGATIYYRRKTLTALRAFPAGFEMIAGDRHATSPQGMQITYWNCGAASSVPAATEVPTCPSARGQSLRLHVNFPSCWDGRHLDNADHQ